MDAAERLRKAFDQWSGLPWEVREAAREVLAQLVQRERDIDAQARARRGAEAQVKALEAKLAEAQEHLRVSVGGGRLILADLTEARAEVEKLRTCLGKISVIRDSIVGGQTFNWSEHAYPLVAVLKEAGFEGAGYEIASANLGTLIEQTKRAESALAVERKKLSDMVSERDHAIRYGEGQRATVLKLDAVLAAERAAHEERERLLREALQQIIAATPDVAQGRVHVVRIRRMAEAALRATAPAAPEGAELLNSGGGPLTEAKRAITVLLAFNDIHEDEKRGLRKAAYLLGIDVEHAAPEGEPGREEPR